MSDDYAALQTLCHSQSKKLEELKDHLFLYKIINAEMQKANQNLQPIVEKLPLRSETDSGREFKDIDL